MTNRKVEVSRNKLEILTKCFSQNLSPIFLKYYFIHYHILLFYHHLLVGIFLAIHLYNMNGLDKISKARALKYVQFVPISSHTFDEFLIKIKNEPEHTDSNCVRGTEVKSSANSGTVPTAN